MTSLSYSVGWEILATAPGGAAPDLGRDDLLRSMQIGLCIARSICGFVPHVLHCPIKLLVLCASFLFTSCKKYCGDVSRGEDYRVSVVCTKASSPVQSQPIYPDNRTKLTGHAPFPFGIESARAFRLLQRGVSFMDHMDNYSNKVRRMTSSFMKATSIGARWSWSISAASGISPWRIN